MLFSLILLPSILAYLPSTIICKARASSLFLPHSSGHLLRNRKTFAVFSQTVDSLGPAPSTPESSLTLLIKSPAINTPLFRAELKKAAIFRGLNGVYSLKKGLLGENSEVAEVSTEGKTQNQLRFLEWVCSLTKDLSQRKVNFQGPSIILHIENCSWESLNEKKLPRGFAFNEEAPELQALKEETQVEAQNMAGTDESV